MYDTDMTPHFQCYKYNLIHFLGLLSEGHALEVHEYWHHWMDGAEALLWLDTNVR